MLALPEPPFDVTEAVNTHYARLSAPHCTLKTSSASRRRTLIDRRLQDALQSVFLLPNPASAALQAKSLIESWAAGADVLGDQSAHPSRRPGPLLQTAFCALPHQLGRVLHRPQSALLSQSRALRLCKRLYPLVLFSQARIVPPNCAPRRAPSSSAAADDDAPALCFPGPPGFKEDKRVPPRPPPRPPRPPECLSLLPNCAAPTRANACSVPRGHFEPRAIEDLIAPSSSERRQNWGCATAVPTVSLLSAQTVPPSPPRPRARTAAVHRRSPLPVRHTSATTKARPQTRIL
ncbi:hypothetical protein BU23DRAFT_635074 [Bimuria novae-zelandiae CBS 107.79]|uniref:Uncharacterized protein n=1 Tax=Bimuria novae-zelandiae CBS 107.79 TaxID=1447943 RepID=A0A6A5VNX5_9PLEO|nr:hypothetical protein BU23DRAFT_635074 [Bimuria novae-zelandiae CBS 107.79]